MKRYYLLVALLLLAMLASCQSTDISPEQECGTERWHVKTLLDPDTTDIVWPPIATTVAKQCAFARGSVNIGTPRQDFEKQVVTVACTIVKYKQEDDNDIHLVIEDSLGNQMIAEIPSTTCAEVRKTSHASEFQSATDWVRTNVGTPSTSFRTANKSATITGLLFQDFPHGQTGAAPSQREIHPVLSIR